MKSIPVDILILGTASIVMVTIILVNFIRGWRLDDEEKESLEDAPAVFYKFLFAVPLILFHFVLDAMGASKEVAKWAATSLGVIAVIVQMIWCYKKSGSSSLFSASNDEANSRIELAAGCSGCGKDDIPQELLFKIDSGQRLCADCLKEMEDAHG